MMPCRIEVVRVIREIVAWDLGAVDWIGRANEMARVKHGRALYESVWSCASRSGKDVRLGRIETDRSGRLHPVIRWVDGGIVLEVVEVRRVA